MISVLVVISIGVGIASLAALLAAIALMPGGESSAAEDRLSALATRHKTNSVEGEEPSLLLAGGLDETKHWSDSLLASAPALSTYISQADLNITPNRLMLICGGLLVVGVVLPIVSPLPVFLAPLFGIVLGVLPLMWLFWKRKRRLQKFANQLPDALELLGRSLRAGHSLAAGFGLIASEMGDPLGKEFQRVFEEQNFGIPLDEALEDLAMRIPNMDVKFFSTAVILQRQTGGDLAEILDKIGRLIRERIQILGQVQALTGEGRISGIVLLAMSPVLFCLMLWLNYDYAMTLFNEPRGQKLLGGALVTQALGAIVIRKIVTIKV